MAVTLQELSDFNRFAEQKLSNGGAETLQQLLDEWQDLREYEQCVVDIRESIRQHENGESLPLDEAFSEIRRKLSARK